MSSRPKNRGIGVGLRPPHHDTFLRAPPSSVSWVEVISENFMPWADGDFRRGIATLLQIRDQCPVALHGVSANLGSADALDVTYLQSLKKLVDIIQPCSVSDHLAWTGVNGTNTHDLLPLPYTEECLENIVRKIDQMQNFLGCQIALENPSSYVEFKHAAMSEPEFLIEVVRRSDCNILLDINNVYVSSVNHQFDPKAYLRMLPKDRIDQIHLAGHSVKDAYLIDTHDAAICAEVWDLFRWYVAQFGAGSVMIERDGNIPTWSEMERELATIRDIHAKIT
ncbi:MAG: DUF692 domain-containing protein [Deltaproteobacteria bacterium]|nr:DUF692 domain-containing protein [Deltaproteobacteria bacterium]